MENSTIPNPGTGKNKVTNGVELIFVFVFLYNCIAWGGYHGFNAKFCGVLALSYVVNGWITSRSTFRIYSPVDFLSDIVLFVLFCWVPSLLSGTAHPRGYDPTFWLAISLIETVFFLWDLLTEKRTKSQDAKGEIRRWTLASIVSVVGGLAAYCATLYGNYWTFFFVTLAVWMWLILLAIVWNVRRYILNKQQGMEFFDD